MSVVYEPRNFIHDGGYPPIDDHHHDATADVDRFPDPNDADPSDAVVNELATTVATFTAPPPPFDDTSEPRLDLSAGPTTETTTATAAPKEDSPATTTPQRVKAIPKPDREVTRNLQGKFVCTWPGCAEEPKEFGRKCEWNKHMDKHDRPYKCAAAGCEKLPGFTYSGGLLRHEREVHGKHGGPKNSFFCPHVNCKRHAGKGFSRQENLNEHLRRVHTQNGAPLNGGEGETDDGASDNVAAAGQKRKRDDDSDLREEMKRLRQENEELRRQVQAQTQQTVVMMQKITQLQQALESRMPAAAPQAPMATASIL
ncbi:90e28286-d78b-413d-863d-ed1944c73796 [Thermothielavioides terrestris]|uniref:90e28286-d78b-413d-863d-ed1944c73796 n=1 Tax=Thermothielavioides terrestris TaxID=2587410 RepID=A0A3S4ANE6_9PEZI|nr:90e28286-d78b-413d-863d-ed1944c73796 [Thermothielavioides terrestris]